MSKVFTWLFGAITGLLAGITLMSVSMIVDPKRFMAIAKSYIEE